MEALYLLEQLLAGRSMNMSLQTSPDEQVK
jgi:hypothetical protein